MAFIFNKRADPNSIEGRMPIGYWQDKGPGSAENANVDKDWDPIERTMVLDYLKLASQNDIIDKGPIVLQQWRGLAFCRLCEEAIGNSCMGDKQYNWPQGYAHYIEKHHVKPPQKFIDHVRDQTKALKK